VDEEGNPVKKGDVGELVVRGDGVMTEYYKNPEATAKALRMDGYIRETWRSRTRMVLFSWSIERRISSSVEGECLSRRGGRFPPHPFQCQGLGSHWPPG